MARRETFISVKCIVIRFCCISYIEDNPRGTHRGKRSEWASAIAPAPRARPAKRSPPRRKRLLDAAGERLIDARHRALLAAACDAMLRRTELVSLQLNDLIQETQGDGTPLVRPARTGAEGRGATLRLAPEHRGARAHPGGARRRTGPRHRPERPDIAAPGGASVPDLRAAGAATPDGAPDQDCLEIAVTHCLLTGFPLPAFARRGNPVTFPAIPAA